MDGGFYQTCYASPNNADVPFAGSTDSGAALSLFRLHAGKNPTSCQFGGSASAWPPATFFPGDAQRAFDQGMFCQYDYGTSTTGLNDILANNSTAQTNLGTLAGQLKSFQYPILFRPFWEMNGSWFSWGRTNYTAAQYITIWQNTWQIFADVMGGHTAGSGLGTDTGNCSFFWCPNINTTGVDSDITSRWPGIQYVDIAGWDGYIGNAHFGTTYKTPEQLYGPTRDLILGLSGVTSSTTLGIGEMAVGADLASPGKDGFITAMFGSGGWLETNPQVKYVNWFNDNSAETSTNQNLCFEQDSTSCPVGTTVPQAAFSNAIGRTYFESNIVNATTFPINSKVPFPS